MGIFNRSKTGKTPFACSLPPFTTINAAAGLLFQKKRYFICQPDFAGYNWWAKVKMNGGNHS
jgi:hypothetical protein